MKKLFIAIAFWSLGVSIYAQEKQSITLEASPQEPIYNTEIESQPARIITVVGSIMVYALKESSWETIYVYNGYDCCPVRVVYQDANIGISAVTNVSTLKGEKIGPNEGQKIAYDDVAKTIWIK